MKIAIPILSDSPDAVICPRFARSPFFAVADTAFAAYEIIENSYYDKKTGAGKSIAHQLVSVNRVNAFLAFELGLKVQQYANENKIQLIILNNRKMNLQDILKLMKIIKE